MNHFTTKFNSIDYSISFFPPNSIQKSIQNFEIGCIQFNKIFIQLGNAGIDDQNFSQRQFDAEEKQIVENSKLLQKRIKTSKRPYN